MDLIQLLQHSFEGAVLDHAPGEREAKLEKRRRKKRKNLQGECPGVCTIDSLQKWPT